MAGEAKDFADPAATFASHSRRRLPVTGRPFLLTPLQHSTINYSTCEADAEIAVQRCDRIRLARRRSALSQARLGQRMGVQRSAVANWKSGAASPSSQHLDQLACVLEVAHEWLATGRGEISLSEHWHDTSAADAEFVESQLERRLLRAWRALPMKPRIALLEFIEAYDRRRKMPCDAPPPHNR